MSAIHEKIKVAAVALGLGATVACGAGEAEVHAPIRTVEEVRTVVRGQCRADPRTTGDVWADYRRRHPFHAQEVALSAPLPGGCRVLVLAEPPPSVTPATLAGIHPALADLAPVRHPVGVDGWTEDLVGVLPPLDDEALAELSSALHVSLFGTAYRARLAPISPAAPSGGTLDVEVRPAELHAWVFGPDVTFWPLDGGPAQRASDLMRPAQTGVYASSQPGLVVWSFPRRGSFDAQRVNVRMFGVESDLILGAIGDADSVLVIGRERIVPTDVLPPLRFETVELLATTSQDQLAQSYERLQLFAGPLATGTDWAPILLSPALVDTEFGSVLDIADQILKRWSLNGDIAYERFEYPGEPTSWASPRPIDEELAATSLTFNWNTAASGGLVHLAGGRDLYWMNRTGALHVSYLPGDRPDPRTTGHEERARDFFARASDPYLVRAVQYTSLFQAFRQLGVTSADPVEDNEAMLLGGAPTAVLENEGEQAFQRLTAATEADLDAAGQREADRSMPAYLADARLKSRMAEALRPVPPELHAKATALMLASLRAEVASASLQRPRALRAKLGADPVAPRHLAVALVYQPLAAAATEEPARFRRFAESLRTPAARARAEAIGAAAAFLRGRGLRIEEAESWRATAAMFASVDAVEKRYREASARRPSTGRVRTPSVVHSRGNKIGVTGGHNVGSRVAALPQRIAPAQLSRVALTPKSVAMDAAPTALRERPVALAGIAARPRPTAAASSGGRPAAPRTRDGGWARLPEDPSFSCGSDCVAVAVFDAGDGTPLRSRFKFDVEGSVFRASAAADVAEPVTRFLARSASRSGGKAARIDFAILDERMTSDEARAVARSVHTSLTRQALGAEDGYVFYRSGKPIALDDFDLHRAVVTAAERPGGGHVVSVAVPPKQGLGTRLLMRLSRSGKPAANAAEQAREAVTSGLRSPAEIARDLRRRFGADDDVSLLELSIDGQPLTSDNTAPNPLAPLSRHAGTPGHTL